MSYVILGIICLAAGFVAGFQVNRNNATKIGKIDQIIKEGDFSAATVQRINDVITGKKDDCEDCK